MAPRIDPYSLVGTTLRERYTIVSFGGVGRFSIVYRAIEAETQRPVALRFLKVRSNLTPSQRTVIVERLRSLVQPMVELAEHHPSFADVLEVTALVLSEGRWMPVLVQPWLDGQSLESVLVSERQTGAAKRTLGRTIDLLSPVADALQYAHARGLVHGNLAPRSLFVRGRRALAARSGPDDTRPPREEWSEVEVLDLGLAQALATLQAQHRAFSESPEPLHFFAPAYGAPEQFAVRAEPAGPAADVFALALVVVELVTGNAPLGEGDDEQLERASIDPVYRPTPSLHGVALGPYVEAVLERAVAVRASDRYATVASFWDALRAASRVMLRGSSSSILPPPLPAPEPAPASSRLPLPPALPDIVTMKSIVADDRATPPVYARALAKRDFTSRDRSLRDEIPPRELIPAHRFFAPSEEGPTSDAAVSVDEVASVTNPMFGGISNRSVAPSAMDVPTPSERAEQTRSRARIVRVTALAASLIVGVSSASIALRAVTAHASTRLTPLPADVIAAFAAIKPAVAPVLAPCPSGMVRITGGRFTMGSSSDLAAEKPAHEATLAPYCLDALEVTVEKFASYLTEGAHGRRALAAPTSNAWAGITLHDRKAFDPLCNARDAKGRASHPMNCVDWKTATSYCTARGARLPTEAEWELAARGADGRRYPWGNDDPSPKRLNACGKECVAWGHAHGVDETAMFDSDDGFPTTAPVGSFPAGASPYGIEDVAGNVWEWTSDWYGAYRAEAAKDPKGVPSGTERVVRGGAWNGAHADWVRPSFRWHSTPGTKSYAIGFRCAE